MAMLLELIKKNKLILSMLIISILFHGVLFFLNVTKKMPVSSKDKAVEITFVNYSKPVVSEVVEQPVQEQIEEKIEKKIEEKVEEKPVKKIEKAVIPVKPKKKEVVKKQVKKQPVKKKEVVEKKETVKKEIVKKEVTKNKEVKEENKNTGIEKSVQADNKVLVEAYRQANYNTIRDKILSSLKYPERARKLGIEGSGFIIIVIDGQGNIISRRAENFPNRMLQNAALKAAKNVSNAAAHSMASVELKIPINFNLR